MSYSQALSAILNSLQAVQGDLLRVRSKGKVYEGTLMPHHDFSDPDVIILKLKNGYNIGIRISSDDVIEVLEKAETKERPPRSLRKRSDLPRVVLLGTGGTIASYVDYRSGAVHPALSTEDLVSAVPEIGEMASVEAKVLFSIFSENMAPSHWQDLALAAAYELNNGAEAVIIPHGTDTMSYTAAALSFMLGEIPRPVVLVGAQRSSDRPSSDAHSNLLAATRFALEQDVAEVSVLMHSGPSDDAFSVHRGTRVRKMHTSRRDAFQSINVPPLALIDCTGTKINLPHRRKGEVIVTPRTDMEQDVVLLQYYPGMRAEQYAKLLSDSRGAVIAGSGLGHVSKEMLELLRGVIRGGTEVVMTSQCLYGSTNLNVYDTGRDLIKAGVITVDDMLPETAYVKLKWVLANCDDVREAMRRQFCGELGERRDMYV